MMKAIALKKWEENQGRLIFLRDCLSLSIALDSYAIYGENPTEIGAWVNAAKYKQDEMAMKYLVDKAAQTIRRLPFYRNADVICAVPAPPDKEFDLPREVTSRLREAISKPNITEGFEFHGAKKIH